jgi:2-hydroxy-6-oxonona-2,4-dienedioate hydrolase
MSRPQREVQLRGAVASYREAGAGPVAIMAAGLGLTSRFYENSYEAFAAAGVRLVVPDLPGWGRTPGPLTGISPEQTARFLMDFAAAMGTRRAVWLGHSLGAQAVVELAARRPDLARGIVLVGPTGAPGRTKLMRQAWGLAVEASRTSLHVLRGVTRDYVRTPPTRYLGTWLRHSGHDLLARLPQVQCPALVLAGDADPLCRPWFIELLRHRMPQAEIQWVRGGTHALPRGHAADFNRVVTAFLRGTTAPGRQ